MSTVSIEVSIGEAIDRWVIAGVKLENLSIKFDRENPLVQAVGDELARLSVVIVGNLNAKTDEWVTRLRDIHRRLWDVENVVRGTMKVMKKYPHIGLKGDEARRLFKDAAKKVPVLNDERARIKQKINELLGSTIQEVKSYDGFELGDEKHA